MQGKTKTKTKIRVKSWGTGARLVRQAEGDSGLIEVVACISLEDKRLLLSL